MRAGHIDEHTLKVLEFDQVRRILASFASSTLGKDAAAALYPSLDADWVARRIAETAELKNLLEQNVAIPLAGLSDIRGLITDFGRARTVFEPGELLQIAGTLGVSARLKKFFAELPRDQSGHLQEIAGRLLDFTAVVDEINRCIEDEKTVRDDASPKLKEIRGHIRQLAAQIESRFKAVVSAPDVRNAIENDKPMLRHGRIVVAIKTRYRHYLRGIVLDRSNTGATLYVEPEQLVQLSNELEDTMFAERKEIGSILWQLTRSVIDRKKDILACLKTLALFDLTYAKARFSIAYCMSPPAVRPLSALVLRQGRHPLLLNCVSEQKACPVAEATNEVVPIDIRLGEDFDLLLVTGPNTGGKTVMLKTIGLLSLMAQSGMHIPAHPDSTMPVYHQIFADIGDEQSIQQSLSTFSAHISQIVKILKNTNEKTLVLLDELGAGTDPVEGAVLATAILDRLLARGSRIVATTHLGRLKSYAYTTPKAQNASVQFDTQTLKPTYRVLIGTPGSSNALAIAERLGMAKALISRARSVLDSDADGTSELINQVQATREDAEQKRSQAQKMLDQAQSLRAEALQRLEELKNQRVIISDQANKEIDKSMQQLRSLVDGFLSQMQNAPKPWSEYTEQLCRQLLETADSTPLASRQARFAESVRKGDSVYVAPFRRNGIVFRVNRKRRVFTVLVEGKQVEVSFADVWQPDGRPH